MGILISKQSRVLVQGITGKTGRLQTETMLAAGTNVVAGVTPGKGGEEVLGIKVYDYVREAAQRHRFDAVISFAPPKQALNSALEAMDADISLLVLPAEGIPAQDVVRILAVARERGVRVVGPGCSGIIVPGVCKVGSHPARFFTPGPVGVVSKSGALSYEIGKSLTDSGIGQSAVIGLGGGPIWGTTQRDAVELYQADPDTKVIVLLGEIGGSSEEQAAEYIKENVDKPVVALIVGQKAPKGKSLGHAGAIVSSSAGTAEPKIRALREAGATVISNPGELVEAVKKALC